MDDLDQPFYSSDQREQKDVEVHELEMVVMLLSATLPILVVIVGMLLLKLSHKAAGLLKDNLGASAAASSHAQGMMTIDIKGAAGMPDMIVSMSEDAVAAAAVSVPDAASPLPHVVVTRKIQVSRTPAGKRYGLPDDLLKEMEDLQPDAYQEGRARARYEGAACTANEMAGLESDPAFRDWMAGRGMTNADIDATRRRLAVYKELQELDPATFKELTPAVRQYITRRAPRHLLLLDYLLSIWLCLLPGLAAVLQWGKVERTLLSLLATWPILAWACSRSCLGTQRGLWYEETRWGHRATAPAVLLAGLIEVAYCGATLGIGLLVSVWLRCFTLRQQTLGERVAGIRLVREEVS